MPKVEVSKKDMEKLVGKKIKQSELDDLLSYAKCEYESTDGDIIKTECKDTNRPDLWCAEGIARQIRGGIGKAKGVPEYKNRSSKCLVRVDPNLKKIRPRIACAVVKNIKITDEVIKQVIQMQEKITGTFGRNRKEAAIGVYDFDKIKWPVRYGAYAPSKLSFIPLEMDRELNLLQVLQKHPKGREFAHLLEGHKKYPILIDADKNVLSMPPVINSNHSGKVTADTKNLFIEVTGFDDQTIHTALNAVVASLADRGGNLHAVKVKYGLRDNVVCPNFKSGKIKVAIANVNQLSGLNLTRQQILENLKKARLNASISGNTLLVEYPAYRQDILHEVDIIEDLLVAYGYHNLESEDPEIAVIGGELELEVLSRRIREFLVGFGAQGVITYTLTNKDKLFNRMNIKNQKCIEIANPVSQNWSVLRNWLTPSIMEFLGNNTNSEYPQMIFEAGDVVVPNSKAETMSDTVRKLVFAKAHQRANFTEIKQILKTLLNGLELEFEVDELDHDSFIPGRVGLIKVSNKIVGIIGELHPSVLKRWRLENPVALFELNLTELLKLVV